ncbi:transposase [bacterium]|nr:transposase [bacterium]
MLHATAPVLFKSTTSAQTLAEPANAAWLAVLALLAGRAAELFRRRYHVALTHFRRNGRRARTSDHQFEVVVDERGEAKQVLLLEVYSGGPAQAAMFVPIGPGREQLQERPGCLTDFSVPPPTLSVVLEGPGRPPIDGLCLLRSTAGAIAMGLSDAPSAVYALLRRNPTFAQECGFLGANAHKLPGEWTSRALPSESLLEEFDAVMTRYGFWHELQRKRVHDNIEEGAVVLDDVLACDTAHIMAASGCSSVTPPPTEKVPQPKSRKVGRVHKLCDCGKEAWGGCLHPWQQTDPGAAVVVKGPTRKHWAHKASIVTTGRTDIPLSIRVCNYAATPDGKTLLPHLAELAEELPRAVKTANTVVADAVYRGNNEGAKKYDIDVIVGITGRKTRASLAGRYPGIDRFTPNGVPVCQAGHAFAFRGRDIKQERFIWQATADEGGTPVCTGCSLAPRCLVSGSSRRHLRVQRQDFPQIDWEHPQHQALHAATYSLRTGVERGIKRIKKDLGGEHLTRRGASRVQAHLDRRMLVLHLLLAAANTS